MRNERAWPQRCWKSYANGSSIVALRFANHGTKEMLGVRWKVWLVSNFAQQHATTSNKMQQGVQTDATCWANNVGSCWSTLLGPFARSRSILQSFDFLLERDNQFQFLTIRRRKRQTYTWVKSPPVKTDTTSLANNSRHCWMLHASSVCPGFVAQSLKPVAKWKRTQHVGPTMLGVVMSVCT